MSLDRSSYYREINTRTGERRGEARTLFNYTDTFHPTRVRDLAQEYGIHVDADNWVLLSSGHTDIMGGRLFSCGNSNMYQVDECILLIEFRDKNKNLKMLPDFIRAVVTLEGDEQIQYLEDVMKRL